MKPGVYHHPQYYEVAFSYRDILAELAVFNTLIDRHSDIPVSNVLELGCGPAPYVEALTQHGYAYTGLDLSQVMLQYARYRTDQRNLNAEFQLGDMLHFQLDKPMDFAFLLLGSLFIRNTSDLISHFDSVARTLRPGGLYLLEQCVAFAPFIERTFKWELSQDGIAVKTTFHVNPLSHVDQTAEETLTMEVSHHNTTKVLQEVWLRRLIFPQEFLMFIANRNDFEFVGWWKNWSLAQSLDNFQANNRSIVLVKRVQNKRGLRSPWRMNAGASL
jgi:SAM-dependent methyltransferase